MCGLIGFVSTKKDADPEIAEQYVANQYEEQHQRGKDGFGITAIDDEGQVHIFRATEAAKMMADLYIKARGMRHILLHHRNPTSTDNSLDQTHPMIVSNKELKLDWIINHNGVIRNAKELRPEHEKLGYEYLTHYDQFVSEYTKTTIPKFNDSESFAIELARHLEGITKDINIEGPAAFMAVASHKKTGRVVKIIIGTNGLHPLKTLTFEEGVGFASLEEAGDAIEGKKSITFTPEYAKNGKLIKFAVGEPQDVVFRAPAPIVAVPKYHARSDDTPSYEDMLKGNKNPVGFRDRDADTGNDGVVHARVGERSGFLSKSDEEDLTKASTVVSTLRKNNLISEEEGKLIKIHWRLMDVEDVNIGWSDVVGTYCLIDVAKKAHSQWKEAYARKQDVDHKASLGDKDEFKSYAHILEYVTNIKPNRKLFNDNATHAAFNEFDIAKFSAEFTNGNLKEASDIWDEFVDNAMTWLDPEFIMDAMDPGLFLDQLPKDKGIFTSQEIIDAAKQSVDRRMATIAKELVPLFKLQAWVEMAMHIGWQFQTIHDAEEAVTGLLDERFPKTESQAPAPAPAPAKIKALPEAKESTEDNKLEDARTEAGAALSALSEMAETEEPEVIYREAEEVAEKIRFVIEAETIKQMREASALAAEQGVAIKIGTPLTELQSSITRAKAQLEKVASIVNATKSREAAESGLGV